MDALQQQQKILGHNGFLPSWFHPHGVNMFLGREEKLEEGILVIAGGSAEVIISKASLDKPGLKGYFVCWRLQVGPYLESVNGHILFGDEQLEAAFGLSDSSDQDRDSKSLLDRFGAHSAAQGKYIRWNNFLNIPCAGTGKDGDPNVSIIIDDKIKEAVRQLLG